MPPEGYVLDLTLTGKKLMDCVDTGLGVLLVGGGKVREVGGGGGLILVRLVGR